MKQHQNFYMGFIKSIIDGIGKVCTLLFTGGRYGTSVRTDRSREYAKRQEKRHKDFLEYGGHDCKICHVRIPANKYYCAPCYFKYIKK
ncbi:hypothetical protein K8942_01830 [Candidatus Peribacteria bacterium]|nr:MAG: hypothetical protein K8942_01830 [Candidatus Peribacteria bacterium]